ncbi:MAG: 3-hydroxyacyl-CoA dehydrogenase PaaH [Gemmatimonadota bacterium]
MSQALSSAVEIGVIGAGAMGAGIAQVAARAGHRVRLHDANRAAVEAARAGLERELRGLVAKGKLAAGDAEATIARVQPAATLDDFGACGLIVEAVVEDLGVKQNLFRALEGVVGQDCVFATNTSSLSITAVGAALAKPERLVGMHFFNPPTRMRLVEVVSGMATAEAVAQTVAATARAWGKHTVFARSTPGFIVNRLARPFYAEAWRVLAESAADCATLDAVMRDCGGFPMGPFELMDLIGHDVNLTVTKSVFDATFGDRRYAPSLAQQELVRAGWLGRKSGRGIYDYRPGAAKPAPKVEPGADPVSRVTLVGSLGIATPIVTRLERAGIEVVRVENRGGTPGWLEIGSARVMLSDGRCASQRSLDVGQPQLVLFDLALDYAIAPRLALARADQCGEAALRTVCATLARAGFECSRLDDVAGMIVLRTTAMLVNEAADAVAYGICTADAIDESMTHGVNYPRGPMAWAEAVGLDFFALVLGNLRAHYGEERYRTSVLIQRRGWSGAGFEGRQ